MTKFFKNQPVRSYTSGMGVVYHVSDTSVGVQFGKCIGTFDLDGRRANGHPIDLQPLELETSRSASPQQGTEGAEEVLMKTDKLNIDIVDTANGKILHIRLVDAIEAMHQFAQSQVEQAVKEKDLNIAGQAEVIGTLYSQIVNETRKVQELEAALKVQTEHVADLMAASVGQVSRDNTIENATEYYKKWAGDDSTIELMFAYAASLVRPELKVQSEYEIKFGKHLLCKVIVDADGLKVFGACDGWGDGVSSDDIVVTRLNPPQ